MADKDPDPTQCEVCAAAFVKGDVVVPVLVVDEVKEEGVQMDTSTRFAHQLCHFVKPSLVLREPK